MARLSGRNRIAAGVACAAVALGAAAWLAGATGASSFGNLGVARVDDARLLAADSDRGDWLTYGRTYDEQRFSPLTQVNADNAGKLGLAWSAEMDSARGQEATPIVVDGKMYVSTAWSMVKAFDAKTGKALWAYDPEVPRETLVKTCCDAVNRGVAVYKGKVIVATLDGRLVALNAATGKPVWTTRIFDAALAHTNTGAPRIAKGMVLIGAGGAEYNVRGFISAYDAETGKRIWRFYTVPGNPAKGFEQPAMAKAAATWKGQWWKRGGGGTVWDSIVYDPKLDLIIFGTGNADPWNPEFRAGGGANLYTSSIVAVRPETGKYVWHFQETPEDRWDFDSTQPIMIADLPIGGAERRVVLHAPKNGFFYVLDAATGKFLSGKAFTAVNWTNGLDAAGHPRPTPESMYEKTGNPFVSLPGAVGAHSWQPMAFSPKTGLVYLPINEAGYPYVAAGHDWKPEKVGFNTGLDPSQAAMPADTVARDAAKKATTGALIAWDPVAQREVWRHQYLGPWNGGVLATSGNLVFQGTAGSTFNAFAADTGRQLWSYPVQTGIIAAPITYEIDGQQYVAVMAGFGGVWDIATGVLADKSGPTRNISRLLVFKLGAKGILPPAPPVAERLLDPPPVTAPALVAAGGQHYGRYCAVCHGDAAVAGSLNPDLRHSITVYDKDAFQTVVHDGARKSRGMVSFAQALTPADVEGVRQYILKRANEDRVLEREQKVASR